MAKAREQVAPFSRRARVLVANVVDGTGMPEPPAGRFDAGLDIMCLHMLVVDADRRAYLRNACRSLKPGAPMLFCNELWRADAWPHPVASLQEWACLTGDDYATPIEREAWEAGQPVKVMLPLIAARARTVEQYREEMEAAGFTNITLTAAPGPCGVSFTVWRDGADINAAVGP